MELKRDIFESPNGFTLTEAKSEVDGQNVIARVEGVFFVPEGVSRNKRFYPKSLWEKALAKKEIKEKLNKRRMLGTIGHDQIINDQAILEGKVSHIVTDLRIDENGQGIGEALILDTPAGRSLNTLLRAGSELFVSSRAMGRFKPDQKKNGMPVVDENNYELQTFDFVIDPGFLEANPNLRETLEIDLEEEKPNTNSNEGVGEMDDKKLATHIIDENNQVKADLNVALSENDELKGKLAIANNESENLKEELAELEETKTKLASFEELGSVEEIKEALEAKKGVEAELKEWKEIDTDIETPAEVIEVVEKATEKLSAYAKIGSVDSITEALTSLKTTVDAYDEYGTVEEVAELYDFAKVQIDTEKENKKNEAIKALAEELEVPAEKVEKLYGKLSEEEIRETFEGVKVASKSDDLKETYTKDEVDLEEDNNDKNEDESYEFEMDKPLVERLMNIR